MTEQSYASSQYPVLFHLIQDSKWKKLSKALRSNKAVQLVRQKDETGLNCLSLAIGYHAPVEIVEKMISVDPELAFEKDVYGETALHVACLNGAPLNIVSLLIEKHQALLFDADHDNRTPLHHAVEYACEREPPLQGHEDQSQETYVDVVLVLCEAAPETLYHFDKTMETPIDLVQTIKTNCDTSSLKFKKLDEIYNALTEQSIKYYKSMKQTWELEGYLTKVTLDETGQNSMASTSVSSSSSLRKENQTK